MGLASSCLGPSAAQDSVPRPQQRHEQREPAKNPAGEHVTAISAADPAGAVSIVQFSASRPPPQRGLSAAVLIIRDSKPTAIWEHQADGGSPISFQELLLDRAITTTLRSLVALAKEQAEGGNVRVDPQLCFSSGKAAEQPVPYLLEVCCWEKSSQLAVLVQQLKMVGRVADRPEAALPSGTSPQGSANGNNLVGRSSNVLISSGRASGLGREASSPRAVQPAAGAIPVSDLERLLDSVPIILCLVSATRAWAEGANIPDGLCLLAYGWPGPEVQTRAHAAIERQL